MGKPKGRRRIEGRLVDMDQTPDEVPGQLSFWEPDLTACQEKDFILELDPDNGYEVYLRYHEDLYGQVVEFAIIQQVVTLTGCIPVVRYDTCHGTVHRHEFDRYGDEVSWAELQPITCRDDVASGYDYCYNEVFSEWEAQMRRWSGDASA